MTSLYFFLTGAAAMAFATVAVFFLRFHRKTHERLFAIFAGAFALLALERVILVAFELHDEVLLYLLRLASFVLILFGIADKNRASERAGAGFRRRSRA